MGSRYIKDLWLGLPEDGVCGIIQRFLDINQFVIKSDIGRLPYYVSGENPVPSYCFFQYDYKDGSLHLEAWLGLNNVKTGLTGWGAQWRNPIIFKGSSAD